MGYGLVYQGSKNFIAKEIVDRLPPATHFYDLFAGGCAITHAAMESGKYKYFHINDVSNAHILFADGVKGKYRDEKRWISREDFFKLKDVDEYVRVCWSFGCSGEAYLYPQLLELFKKALWYALMFNDYSLISEYDERIPSFFDKSKSVYENRISWRHRCNEVIRGCISLKKDWFVKEVQGKIKQGDYYAPKENIEAFLRKEKQVVDINENTRQNLQNLQNLESLKNLQNLKNLESLESLESLERLQNLKKLQSLESLQSLQSRLIVTQKDYSEVEIEKDSVVYCFDKDTEILTLDGWKLLKDIDIQKDMFLSREPQTKRLEYVKAVNYINYKYKGDMYKYEGRGFDLCITPNHRMFVNRKNGRNKTRSDDFITAERLFNNCNLQFISAGAEWQDYENDTQFDLCGQIVDKKLFARFLGIFVTYGCVNNQDIISITQSKEHILEILCDLLEKLNIKHSKNKYKRKATIFYISKKYLSFFKQFRSKETRGIPFEFLNTSKENMQALIDGMLDGDSDNERRKLYCGSKTLSNDFMELCFKCGYASTMSIARPKESFFKDENGIIKGKKPYYITSLRKKEYLTIRKDNKRVIKYNDDVYCITLEKWHTVLVRRNGKSVWCGQCDPPYVNSAGYNSSTFDHDRFYKWALEQKNIYISEYQMPDCFEVVWSRKKRVNLQHFCNLFKDECLFIPKSNEKHWTFETYSQNELF